MPSVSCYVVPGSNNPDNIFLNGNMLRLLDIFKPLSHDFAYTTDYATDPNTLIFGESLLLVRAFLDKTGLVGRRCVVVTQEVYHETTTNTFELHNLNPIHIYNCLNGKFYITPFYNFYGLPEGSLCMAAKTRENYTTKLSFFGNLWRQNWSAPCSLYLRRTQLAVRGLQAGLIDDVYSRDFCAVSATGEHADLERDIATVLPRVHATVHRQEKLRITSELFYSLECLPTMCHNFATERPFDAILSGCVPVFMGTDSLKAVFPVDSVVYMDEFSSDEACLRFVKAQTYDDWAARMAKCEAIIRKLAPAGNTGDHHICTLLKSILQDVAPLPSAINIFDLDTPLFLNRIGGTDYTLANLSYESGCPGGSRLDDVKQYSGYFDKHNRPETTAQYLACIAGCIKRSPVVMETLPARRTDGRYAFKTAFEREVLHNHLVVSYNYVENVYPFLLDFKSFCDAAPRRVLVVSPFSATIRHQYRFKSSIVHGFAYPTFELLTYDVPITYNDDATSMDAVPFADWNEASAAMCAQIGELDFDFAMISAGSYTYPIGDHISQVMKKKCIYVGGIMNVLFGIQSGRYHVPNSGYENINPPHRLLAAFEMSKVTHIRCSRGRSSEAVSGYFGTPAIAHPKRACVVYAGAYNVFDAAIGSHTRNVFEALDAMGIDYDVFASIAEAIELRSDSYSDDADAAAAFVERNYLTNPAIAQHVPPQWHDDLCDKKVSYNCRRVPASDTNHPFIVTGDKLLRDTPSYCRDTFAHHFGEKLKAYVGTSMEQLYDAPAVDNPHEIDTFFATTLYARNRAMAGIVREHERAMKRGYDVVISLRPDLFVEASMKDAIADVLADPTQYYCGRQSDATHLLLNTNNHLFRVDFMFVGRCFFSELVGERDKEALRAHAKDGPYNTFETSIATMLNLLPIAEGKNA
jgi:hypothetical protein